MVVASSDWRGPGEGPKLERRNGNKPLAGLRVVATLFALRLGYRLAKSAVGKLFAEHKAAPGVEAHPNNVEVVQVTAESDDVTAREQWVVCVLPAPEVPDGFKLMASEHLPISTYHFYEQFLSVETQCLQDHHKSTGQYNFRASRWKGPDGEDCHFSRVLDFWQPKKGIQPSNAHCVQQQRFSVHPGGVFVMQTDMVMEHIPYADCFRVRSFWKAVPDSTGVATNVSIHVAVVFIKGCLMKGIINKTTLGDCTSFYSDFLAKVQNSIATELLPQATAAAAAAEQLLGASPDGAAAEGMLQSPRSVGSPFAAVDAEVLVRAPHQGNSSFSNTNGRQQHKHKGWWPWRKQRRQPNQVQHQLRAGLGVEHAAAAASLHRQLSRAVSAKPSFAQPIGELHLPSRSSSHEVISSTLAILVLLVLFVQLLTLYDNLALHRQLAAATHPHAGG